MKGEFTMSERVYDSFAELIGHTPLLRLNNMMKNHGAKAEVLAKLEYFNPGGIERYTKNNILVINLGCCFFL